MGPGSRWPSTICPGVTFCRLVGELSLEEVVLACSPVRLNGPARVLLPGAGSSKSLEGRSISSANSFKAHFSRPLNPPLARTLTHRLVK
jgi:hypothetical protein